MKKKTLFLSGAAVAAAATGWAYYRYRQQMKGTFARLRAESEVLRTPHGDVEYTTAGKGPSVLISHGALQGYDHAIALGEWVAQTVPGARFIPIEGGHICLFTHSAVTLPALAGFLGEHAPGR